MKARKLWHINSSSFSPRKIGFLLLSAAAVAIGVARADTPVSGMVSSVWAYGSGGGAPGNYDFRVYLSGYPVVCDGQTWGYVNVSDANYNVIAASVLSAKAAGYSITMYIAEDANGYCHIDAMLLN